MKTLKTFPAMQRESLNRIVSMISWHFLFGIILGSLFRFLQEKCFEVAPKTLRYSFLLKFIKYENKFRFQILRNFSELKITLVLRYFIESLVRHWSFLNKNCTFVNLWNIFSLWSFQASLSTERSQNYALNLSERSNF